MEYADATDAQHGLRVLCYTFSDSLLKRLERIMVFEGKQQSDKVKSL